MRRCCLIRLKNNSTCQRLLSSKARQGGKPEVIRQKDQALAPRPVRVMDSSQLVRVMLEARRIAQPDDLIAAHSGGWINRARCQAVEFEMRFGSGDAESGRQDKAREPLEIQTAAIHPIKGARLQDQFVQDPHIGRFALGNRNKRGEGAAQIQQRVQFDRRFGPTETRPRKQVQA